MANGNYSTVVEKYLTGRITLLVFKGSVGKPANVVTALPVVSGLLSGHQWEPFGTSNYRFADGQLIYNVAEILHWDLLGMTVFTEVKEFKGTLMLSSQNAFSVL